MAQVENKYRQIADYIKGCIRRDIYPAKSRLPSEEQLAAELKVSRSTVRKAYEELMTQGIVRRARGSGTFVETSVNDRLYESGNQSGARQKIGIILPGPSEFMDEVYEGILEGLAERGQTHKLCYNSSREEEKHIFMEFIREGYHGIILSPNRLARGFQIYHFENYKLLDNNALPYVLIGKPPVNVFCNAVYYDDIYGAYSAVKHLFYWGCKRILHITNRNCEYQSVNERMDGFRYAMERYFDITDADPYILNAAERSFGKRLLSMLKEGEDKTGILLYDDLMYTEKSFGGIRELITESGKKIPSEVAVIGYNNLSLCETVTPKLTSMAHDKKLIGRKAMELLDLRMANRSGREVKHLILKPQLEIRESV